MRIRSVKPGFWTDKVMARVSVGARLTYIGMWNLADDAGWLLWDIEEMGAALFPYDTPRQRERNLTKWSKELFEARRVRIFPCGHACIPTFADHQHLSGRRTETHLQRHQDGDCPRKSAESGGNPLQAAADGMDGMDGIKRASAREERTPEGVTVDA